MGAADTFWYWFWTVSFVIAGASFASIAAVVTVKGVGDLRAMIRLLEEQNRR